jgi:hypothetical protein
MIGKTRVQGMSVNVTYMYQQLSTPLIMNIPTDKDYHCLLSGT